MSYDNVHSEPSSILKQMLMLQQQIYQEEQTPIGELQNNSTQFYSHYSKQSYTSSYYMNQQTWQPYGGCYQEKYQQKNYNNGYKCKYCINSHKLASCVVSCMKLFTVKHLIWPNLCDKNHSFYCHYRQILKSFGHLKKRKCMPYC